MYGEERGGHPNRQVGRERFVYEDAVNLNGERPIGAAPMVSASHRTEGRYGPVNHQYMRPANQGPTVAGGPLETAEFVSDPNYRGRPWSKPNPGGYTDDEISNIMRNSGP